MRLFLSLHALKRMEERCVSREDIEHALANCHSSWETSHDSIQYEGEGADGLRTLKVWLLPPGVSQTETMLVVKSVAWKDED